MESNAIKSGILVVLGAIGGFISTLFGGWNSALTTLVIFMAVDYIMGIIVAGVFRKSGKSENGGLSSRAGWKGLCKKIFGLIIVLVAVRLDITIGTTFVKDAVATGYIANETLSIIENAGLMGIPIPGALKKAIDVLKQNSGEPDTTEYK